MEQHGYTVVRALHGGANGRVYEAKDREGRLRVVKQLPWLNQVNKEDAMREVRLLAALRHPCIVPYLENFLIRSAPSLPTEDVLCLVMSRCEHDLRQECQRRRGEGKRVDGPHALSWLAQLCWGLHHLHSRKFLHRDLKPQNVLLTQSRRVLLADFGVACQNERTEDLRSTRVGTLAFMSPEMLDGRPYGRKTDQWALGCVLYEIMTLEPPFVNCLFDSKTAVSEAFGRVPHDYCQELRTVLKSLLAARPEDRPSNAELLRGPLLWEPFHVFVRSLEAAAAGSALVAAADRGRSRGLQSPLPEATASAGVNSTGRTLHGGITSNMRDFLMGVHIPLPAPASRLEEADAASCESDIERFLRDSHNATPVTARSHVLGSYEDERKNADAAQIRSGVSSESSNEQEQTFALGSAGLNSDDWRQLLDEAEALLQPNHQDDADALDEVERLRRALGKILGSETEVDNALRFMRERQPLSETEDADELLLQVEIVDLFGDDGLHALPLLERCLALELSPRPSPQNAALW